MKKDILRSKKSIVTGFVLFLFMVNNVAMAQSTDATLKDIKVGGVSVTGFASTILTYNVVLAFGTTIPPVVTATVNSSHAIEFVQQALSVTGTATILVTAQDGVTTKTYSVVFSVFPFPSTDATLLDLLVGGTTITGFDKKTFAYNVVLPFGTLTPPVVTAIPNESHASVVITQAPSVTGTATVIVTAQDGTTKITFTINFTVALPLTDATLSDLKVGGTTVTGFVSNTTVYNVLLPAGTTLAPVVSASVTEPHATTVITQAASVSGFATIVVTAQDGVTSKTYTVNFSVASTVATLSDLKVGIATVSGFAANTLIYNVVLPAGTTVVPIVAATVTESHATTIITQAVSVSGSATVVVTAQDGVTTKTYTINFSVASTVATLSDLKVGSVSVSGFAAGTFIYNVVLPAGTTVVPVVTATVTESHATTTITQATSVTGSASVLVTAQDGVTTKTYTLNFSVASTVATLSDLKVGAVTVSGFAAGTLVYNVVLPPGTTLVPVVAVTVTESHAATIITQAASVSGSATVVVTAQDGVTTKTYTINFSVASTVATLSDLKVGTVTVSGFAAGTLVYNVVLPVGTIIVPVVSATVTESHAIVIITQSASVTGSATVVVKAQDGITTNTYTINFSIAAAGINDMIENELNVSMVDNTLLIKLSNGINNLQIYNIEGKIILNNTINSTEAIINTGAWNSGIYILKINSQNVTVTKKLIL